METDTKDSLNVNYLHLTSLHLNGHTIQFN